MGVTALVAHSGGPTSVINASLAGIIEQARDGRVIGRLLGARFGVDGILTQNFIDLFALPGEAVATLRHAPSSAIGSSRRALTTADDERILDVCRTNDVRFLFYTGGNGSMGTAHRIARLARDAGQPLSVIGVPKTIDNDVAGTDHTPGYPSAAKFFACAVRDIGADNAALLDQVQLVEVLGRNAGWLTAATVLARRDADDPPHLVYVPERPLPVTRFLDDVQRVFDRLGRAVVAVCEGQLDEHGEPFGADVRMSSRGPLATNLAHRLATLVTERLGLKARAEKPGLLGRSTALVQHKLDRDEAYRCGTASVRAAIDGASAVMVALARASGRDYECSTTLVPLETVADLERHFPLEWIGGHGNDVRQEFLEYSRPLVGEIEHYPFWGGPASKA
jgi:6-phosphofructokinase 1